MNPAILGSIAVLTMASVSLSAATISTIDIGESDLILQITGAQAIETGGGPATADTRTLYYFDFDFDDPAPNTHDFPGGFPVFTWPYVAISEGVDELEIESGISARFGSFEQDGVNYLTIEGSPVYQFINDISPTDANGNFGPWHYILTDGSPTQFDPRAPLPNPVPIPAAFPLFLSALLSMLFIRRR